MPYDPKTDPAVAADDLVRAVMRKESAFDPNAVSPAGARGLMQIMPKTARDPGMGLAPNPAALTDPKQNVKFGTDYLNALLDRYGGDVEAALVAYNGGAGTADKWLASGRNDNVLRPETRAYYRNITSHFGKANAAFDDVAVKTGLHEPEQLDALNKVHDKFVSNSPLSPTGKLTDRLPQSDITVSPSKEDDDMAVPLPPVRPKSVDPEVLRALGLLDPNYDVQGNDVVLKRNTDDPGVILGSRTDPRFRMA